MTQPMVSWEGSLIWGTAQIRMGCAYVSAGRAGLLVVVGRFSPLWEWNLSIIYSSLLMIRFFIYIIIAKSLWTIAGVRADYMGKYKWNSSKRLCNFPRLWNGKQSKEGLSQSSLFTRTMTDVLGKDRWFHKKILW